MTLKQRIRAGVCQFCGCTEERACVKVTVRADDHFTYESCGWANRGQTVCTAPKCIRRARKEGVPVNRPRRVR